MILFKFKNNYFIFLQNPKCGCHTLFKINDLIKKNNKINILNRSKYDVSSLNNNYSSYNYFIQI